MSSAVYKEARQDVVALECACLQSTQVFPIVCSLVAI